MTNRTGSHTLGVVGTPRGSGKIGGRSGSAIASFAVLGAGAAKWKNQAWIAADGVYEVWVSSPLPSTSPPSGKTGSYFTHVQILS